MKKLAEYKNIRIRDETHKELVKLASYGDSLDTVVTKLIEHWKLTKK